MKQLDLSYGNPTFMEPYWKNIDLSIQGNLPNKYIIGSMPELIECIKKIHIQEKNADIVNKHIVIGNGATQLLTAIMKVYNKPAIAYPPYFMRFPKMAEQANVPWGICSEGIEIVTSPNNPDGTIPNFTNPYDKLIFDLSYNWKQYTKPIRYNERQ